MSRYNFDENELELDDLSLDSDKRRSAGNDVDQPRRSPIRRKDKMRPEERVKAKSKKNHRKLQQRIKYELYDAINE
ncbi:MAG: hypothetical protein PVH85_14315 [Desulfobacterales bacterium]|jgi:hypothetical protein